MNIENFRDVTLISLDDEKILVVSCDSSGGIGEKEEDILKTSGDIVGYFTGKVAIAEILALGAKPITIVDTLSVEMNNTGKNILKGVKKALLEIGIDENIVVTGSTEENFHTVQTGIGVTVIGIIQKNLFRKTMAEDGAMIVLAGLPLVGQDVLENPDKIVSLKDIVNLKENHHVLEILPVGSKGILYEMKLMAEDRDLDFILNKNIKVDLNQSAGPASCILMAVKEEGMKYIEDNMNIPINILGKFVGGENDSN
ncbi:selenophosphate synthase [Clostridium sp. D2Q-14]|uniref:AIR synthase related protein n=1 Tax=Anaeromonas gelatinilytica TaxID=2683194 RepID=UPI00193B916B|nr:AIR synthase related protein [Anaeromonas gelatinilytica]MBS4535492.1 selenophosphate synthase [Anaeromonas gelatinilytica]